MDVRRWPGEVDAVYPELFNKRPAFAKYSGKPGQLTDGQLDNFYRDGYLVVENFFSPEELNCVRDDVDELVEELAQKLYKAGKIKDLYKEQGFNQRLISLEKDFPGANILLHKNGKLPPAFRKLWSHERLLNLVEQFIGPDVAGHPVWNLRTKTPNNEATTVPWHQDSAYMDVISYGLFLFTAWIPLVNTDEVNGCMQVAREGHKLGKLARHECCAGPTWYVMLDEEEMQRSLGVDLEKDIVTCPIQYGGMLLFHNITPHRSLPNCSDAVRWSLDLRWSDPKQPLGFWGMKSGVDMRRKGKPVAAVDWDGFEAVDRTKEQSKSVYGKENDEFDTTIPGPWMKQWEITNHNQHTDSLLQEAKTP